MGEWRKNLTGKPYPGHFNGKARANIRILATSTITAKIHLLKRKKKGKCNQESILYSQPEVHKM